MPAKLTRLYMNVRALLERDEFEGMYGIPRKNRQPYQKKGDSVHLLLKRSSFFKDIGDYADEARRFFSVALDPPVEVRVS